MGLEIQRKFIHIIFGLLLAVLIYGGFINTFILAIITLIFFLLAVMSKKKHIPVFSWFIDKFAKKCDLSEIPAKGPLFYLLGVLIVFMFFPKHIVLASIMVLAFGDSIAHIIGAKYGRTISPFSDEKFLEGALAGMILATFAAMIFVPWYEAFFGAVAAMFVEGLDIKFKRKKVDDNIIIPIVAALCMWLMELAVSVIV